MGKAFALPMEVYWNSVPKDLPENIETELILANLKANIGIHAHLTYFFIEYNPKGSTFASVAQGTEKASARAPLRGYMANRDNNPVIEFLRSGKISAETIAAQKEVVEANPKLSIFLSQRLIYQNCKFHH